MIDKDYLHSLRESTYSDPLRIMVSACLTGIACGYEATDYGDHPSVLRLLQYENVHIVRFCPEDYAFGTPRELCDIHGGTGEDVLDGRARVLTASGLDWTDGMIKAAGKMLETAVRERIEVAVLMDISAACGSQVIYSGNRLAENKIYQVGAGVCAAMLQRHGFRVISQRDYAALEILYARIDPNHRIDPDRLDQNETAWYKEYFGNP